MTSWLDGEIVATCPDCGADTAPWRPAFLDLDWRDDEECASGYLAHALQAHRAAEHAVVPEVGALVRYWWPWRGLLLGSPVYRVVSIRDVDHNEFARSMGNPDLEPLWGRSYTLENPARSTDRCFPFVGDPELPYTFELVAEAPPVEVDLLDLLDWEAA